MPQKGSKSKEDTTVRAGVSDNAGKGLQVKRSGVEIKMWVHPDQPKKANKGSKATFQKIYALVPKQKDDVLVYKYQGKEFECEWRGGDIQVHATSSETTSSSKLPGWSFETPLDWCCAIHYEETGEYNRKISPKKLLFHQDRSLIEWQSVCMYIYIYI